MAWHLFVYLNIILNIAIHLRWRERKGVILKISTIGIGMLSACLSLPNMESLKYKQCVIKFVEVSMSQLIIITRQIKYSKNIAYRTRQEYNKQILAYWLLTPHTDERWKIFGICQILNHACSACSDIVLVLVWIFLLLCTSLSLWKE